MADREPIGAGSRPTGEMPADPTPLHASHDLELLASVTDRERDPEIDATVARMTASCAACAALVADLRAIALGMVELPEALPAPRDFRLSADQATRLRRRGIWRSLLRPFGASGLPGLRPLAGALTALGLVGILATAAPLALPGSAGAALPQRGAPVSGPGQAAGSNDDTGAAASFAAEATRSGFALPGGTAAPESGGKGATSPVPQSAASQAPGSASNPNAPNAASEAAPVLVPGVGTPTANPPSGLSLPPVTFVSILLLLAGVGLFGLRLAARRFA